MIFINDPLKPIDKDQELLDYMTNFYFDNLTVKIISRNGHPYAFQVAGGSIVYV